MAIIFNGTVIDCLIIEDDADINFQDCKIENIKIKYIEKEDVMREPEE